jgi:hypothetical protein
MNIKTDKEMLAFEADGITILCTHGNLLSFIWVGGNLNNKREVAMSYMAISALT